MCDDKCLQYLLFLAFLANAVCLPMRHGRDVNSTLFILCSEERAVSYCSNHGTCYQNLSNSSQVFCRCDADYFGEKCEKKENPDLEPFVLGIAIFAATLLIVLIVVSIILYRRKIRYDNMKKEYEDKCCNKHPSATSSVFYSQNDRKPSLASSAASSINGNYVITNLEKPRHHSYSSNNLPDDVDGNKLENTKSGTLQHNLPPESVNDQKQCDVLSPNEHEDSKKNLDDGDDGASVISDTNLSTTESDRNLIPPPISNISPDSSPTLTHQGRDLYDQYFAERLATNQVLAASGYYPHCDSSYCSHTYSPGRSPNTSPRSSAVIGNISPTSTAHTNQAFVYMQPQGNILYPHTTGRSPKKSTSPTRFGPPQSRMNAQVKNHRKKSPARQANSQAQFRDTYGRHMSLGDLRMMNEEAHPIPSTLNHQKKRARSLENILVDRPTSPASSLNSAHSGVKKNLGVPESNKRNKRPGMWAQTQMR